MNWLPFVLCYAAVTFMIGVGLHVKGQLRLDSPATARAVISASLLLLLGELLAEERGLWLIPAHSGLLLLRTPLESLLLIIATVLSSLQIYVLAGYVLRRRADQPRPLQSQCLRKETSPGRTTCSLPQASQDSGEG